MASIAHNIKERSTNNYITTGSFNGQFFNYTTSFNTTTLTTTGALTAVTGATVTNCPQGRVLRATGKKLYPGGAYPGVSTMLIGVYDSLSLLSGFIDPNSSVFALYNHDKPVDVIDAFDLSGNVIHKGPPVFTLGDVIAGRQIRSTGSTALTTVTGTGAVADQTIDVTLGQTFTLTTSASGAATFTLTPTAGSLVTATLGSTVRIFISQTTANATTITFGTGFRSVGTLATGTAVRNFVITFVVGPGATATSTLLYETGRTAALA
jgi:hypothetical protein